MAVSFHVLCTIVLLAVIGEAGSNPGQLKYPGSLAVYGDEVYVADNYNHRIQVFKKKEDDLNTKAVIVAGGGPYPGNRLWDATRLSANFAYYSLIYQGLQKADICYLSSDAGIDLDNNGKADDIVSFTDCSSSAKDCLKEKITNWASDADRLILYLVDHGGENRFSLTADEILTADELNGWLDGFQNDNKKEVIVIYDACNSGSFQPILRQDSQTPPADCPLEIKPRIVISSAAKDQSAYFLNQGTISFSEFFWSEVFNGASLDVASAEAQTLIAHVTSEQTSAYSACGSLKDKVVKIGYGTQYLPDEGEGTITISEISTERIDVKINHTAEISRVWAVLIPENSTVSKDSSIIEFPSDSTIIGFPSQDLQPSDDCGVLAENQKCYSAILNFNEIGSEDSIVAYATDSKGNTFSSAESGTSGLQKIQSLALLISSGDLSEAGKTNISDAVDALRFQGFADTNIRSISPEDIESNLKGQTIDDLIIYINDPENKVSYTEIYEMQNSIRGNLIVIYEGDDSGDIFLPSEGKAPILISAGSVGDEFRLINGTNLSFSGFFWKNIRNGMTLWRAFTHAQENLSLFGLDSNAQLDDNGNGISDENGDGIRSADIRIGRGISLVPNSPLGFFPEIVLKDGETSAVLQVLYTGKSVEKVYAEIKYPYVWEDGEAKKILIPMQNTIGNLYEFLYEDFERFGIYPITFYAEDGKPAFHSTSLFQSSGPDLYEPDDEIEEARFFWVDSPAQLHSFNPEGDTDRVKFHALTGEIYTISAKHQDGRIADCVNIKLSAEEDSYAGKVTYPADKDMILYVTLSTKSSECNDYLLEIYRDTANYNGYLKLRVMDASTGLGIENVSIQRNANEIQTIGHSGTYLMILPSGGPYTVVLNARGYMQGVFSTAEIPETKTVTQDVYLNPVLQPVPVTPTVNEYHPVERLDPDGNPGSMVPIGDRPRIILDPDGNPGALVPIGEEP